MGSVAEDGGCGQRSHKDTFSSSAESNTGNFATKRTMLMAEVETAIVQVAEGQLRGRRVESRAGGHYWSFQGVPYARPPLGPLRFKDAEPAEPWEGVRDALKEADNCSQLNVYTHEYVGSEDCLYLNVYTQRPPAPRARPLPVMVLVHAGGFQSGSGDTEYYGPDYLVAEGVVLVTFNYRIGVLGFLYLEEASPGNVGLKDQVAALRWVQSNIAAFGGDPKNVTIFGLSAGGTSVHLHMYSPMTKGLFHRAIAMSGAALNPWAIQTEPAETTRRLARCLGCTSDDPAEIVEFLRGVDHMELVRVASTDAVPEKDRPRIVVFSFVPTPEKVLPGVETYLPETAELLMKRGLHHDVPYMTGISRKESLCFLGWCDFRKEDMQKKINDNWEAYILPELRLPPDGPKNEAALEALRKYFMNGKPLSKDTFDGFVDLISDLTFIEGVMYALKWLVKTSIAPIYQYCFVADECRNINKILLKVDEPGSSHGDEKGYLFRTCLDDEALPEGCGAARVRKLLVRLWTNFARTGDPTPNDDPLLGVRWKPYTANERNYLEIGLELRNKTDLIAERVAFWETFYATYGS